MSETKRIDIAEFRRDGYLQELNRRFLHPLGLALEVEVGDDGTERLGGIWDYRDDPEGIYYGEIDWGKYDHIERLWREREPQRVARVGAMLQPAELKLPRWDECANPHCNRQATIAIQLYGRTVAYTCEPCSRLTEHSG